MSIYDTLIDEFNRNIQHKDKKEQELVHRGQRPLKMPKNYDFSVRNVDWSQYKKDFILRTDAVWERSKLLDTFYTHYKVTPALKAFSPNSCTTRCPTGT